MTVVLAVAFLGTLAVLVCVLRAYRHTVPAQAIRDIIDGADLADHGAPCRHPGCMIARTKLWKLLEGK